ncbi:hypothetical protein [Oceanirhabdus seepicola]|uniref:Uncharacterized protein n=1 Tax=Oceanirhabdus seepicola TaxID=2828781 RepID=A0A9J6P6N8_9CLOT|nr:hypothetical protein [Oceanirhabdus seepicola]MCM1991168.1 hypothetical protein [Oceanirhabdus seepicola]
MPRDKSVNSTKTSIALNFYYTKAKEQGMLEQILKDGDFKEDAIKTAIARGRISIKMISAFHRIMGVDPEELTGEKDISKIVKSSYDENSLIQNDTTMSDDELMKIVQLLIEIQRIRPNKQREEILERLKLIIRNSEW